MPPFIQSPFLRLSIRPFRALFLVRHAAGTELVFVIGPQPAEARTIGRQKLLDAFAESGVVGGCRFVQEAVELICHRGSP